MEKYKRNWKTSLIGWAIVIGGAASALTGKTSWADASIVITMGVGFIMAKDA